MKILYYECFAGIAGNMNLGAMLELGIEEQYLRDELTKLGIDDEFELCISRSQKMGITGTHVDVKVLNENAHRHGHHSDKHHPPHKHQHSLSRNYFDIEELVTKSTLSEQVKKLTLTMFMKIAEAEAKVHGKSVEEVHFHEVGAIDSIVDIVGAAICYEKLEIDQVIASTVEVGSGFVTCAHGTMPIPAPATAEILAGVPIHRGGLQGEATTPTGAAILATLCDRFEDTLSMVIEKTGYGTGTKDFTVPNLLRVSLGYIDESPVLKSEKMALIETNIDDMNPELLPMVEEELSRAGARDVWKTPAIMKKGRAATTLSVLADWDIKEFIVEKLLRHTTTLGVRVIEVNRYALHRNVIELETKYGTIQIKEGILNGAVIKYKPEFEDMQKIAREQGVSIGKIHEEVARVYRERE